MKEVFEGKAIGECVGLKSKLHSMKIIYGKESNTAKGVNITNEFNEFKDTLYNKIVLRPKMRRIQGKKNINLDHMKSKKYYLFLMIKDLF